MPRSDAADRLAVVRARIDAATAAAGREPGAVQLVAVSKFHPAAAVAAMHAEGQRQFGESRVQELGRKAYECADLAGIEWHMIGSLQTNKVRELLAVPGLALLHSLDRRKLADALQGELDGTGRRLPALLQIHATGEAQKHGCPPEDAAALLAYVQDRCPALSVEGLMAMGPLDADPEPTFARVAALLADLRMRSGLPLPTLSMGMSGDLEAAIRRGATMVRVGSDLFGPRA